MGNIFQTILYEPIFNLFVGFYDIVPDVGVAILLLTILIKVILYPLTAKSIKAQKSLMELQPKLQEIKETYKDDQQKLAQETMKIYSENKVNPFGSCLPILVQIPIFLALFWVLRDGLSEIDYSALYSFVPQPENLNAISLGIIDLSKSSVVLALLAAAAQFFQAKSMHSKRVKKPVPKGAKDEDMMAMMNKQMLYVMPVMTGFISLSLPGGVALYWFLSTAFTALQQKFLFKGDEQANDTATDVIDGEIVEKK